MEDMIIGYRLDATGIFGYIYYQDGEQICSTGGNTNREVRTVLLNGFGLTWKIENFDIIDQETGLCFTTYKKTGSNKYTLGEKIKVECNEKTFSFYREDNEVATFFKFDNRDNSLGLGLEDVSTPPGYEYISIPYFGIVMDSDLRDDEKLLILSFPELKY